MPSIESFTGLTAVVTGAASGMGREIALQLAAQGCHLALCDVQLEGLQTTLELIRQSNSSLNVTTHYCDVANVESIISFRQEVETLHTNGWNLLFNNAGIGGLGPFLEMPRETFNKIFDVSFVGVVEMTRQFLPTIVKQNIGAVINTSSINGFWSALGPSKWPFPTPPHAPYSSAKAAIRGFTDALLMDAYQNFPHVGVVCVHPGHIGTGIARLEFPKEGPSPVMLENLKERIHRLGVIPKDKTIEDFTIEEMQDLLQEEFKNKAPTSAKVAAEIILNGVRNGRTRILVGEDAVVIDWLARMFPRMIYNDSFIVTVLFPWMMGARVIGSPFGRYLYPIVMGMLGYFGVKGLRSRM